MSSSCLFCEAELPEGAKFCTQCGNKVPLKKTQTAKTKKMPPEPESIESIETQKKTAIQPKFFLQPDIYCSVRQLKKTEEYLLGVDFRDISTEVRELFARPGNLHLRKMLIKKYPVQLNQLLNNESQLPSSSRVLLSSLG